jgi:acetoin:2,6-dichlorophenolindophenol oxidoreductase subunit alpha
MQPRRNAPPVRLAVTRHRRFGHLGPDDYVASTHRGHGHAIAKGCDVKGMMAEIYGKSTGICHGKGGSMHIADIDRGMLGANGIVGGGPPLVCGVGLTAKVTGSDQVAVSFTGDGGSNQGTFLESLNLASAWHLPCVFVVENNGYAEATSSQFHQAVVDRQMVDDVLRYKRLDGVQRRSRPSRPRCSPPGARRA